MLELTSVDTTLSVYQVLGNKLEWDPAESYLSMAHNPIQSFINIECANSIHSTHNFLIAIFHSFQSSGRLEKRL